MSSFEDEDKSRKKIKIATSSEEPSGASAEEPSAASAGEGQKGPKDAHFDRLKQAMTRENALGQMMVKGVETDEDEDNEEDDDEEDDEEEGGKQYTEKKIAKLRHILINDSRSKALTKASKFASCGQSGGFMMFNTTSGNQIISGIPTEIKKAMNKKKITERFDALFALTSSLKNYDFWMHDNEMWGEGGELDRSIIMLGAAWKKLLATSSAELGIDDEFTRPGIEELLRQFENAVVDVECIGVPFQWT